MASKATIINLADAAPEIQSLAAESAEARKAAYCPFSNFAVGAALRNADGTIFRGCNVENSTSGATICAERTACTKAISEKSRVFKDIAVCADMASGQITSPCGICRQVLFEFNPKLPVYCVTSDLKQVLITSLDELLPFGFRLEPPKFFSSKL